MSNTSCNNGRGDELARQRIEVRRPSGRVRVREEGASRDGDRPGVTQEPVINGFGLLKWARRRRVRRPGTPREAPR
jgi:hypothetical protein